MPDASNPGSEKSTDLKLVDEAGGTEPSSAPDDPRGDAGRGVPVWLFVFLALAFVLVVLWQVQVARELEAEVARVEDELARSTALLDAHRSRLSDVRSGIHDLSDRLDGLRALADSPVGDASGSTAPDDTEAPAASNETAPTASSETTGDTSDPTTPRGDDRATQRDAGAWRSAPEATPPRSEAFETRPF